jgi:hypothetical protein
MCDPTGASPFNGRGVLTPDFKSMASPGGRALSNQRISRWLRPCFDADDS